MNTAQQALEARVITKWVESRIHFQISEEHRALAIGLFEGRDGPFIVTDAQMDHCELIRRHIFGF